MHFFKYLPCLPCPEDRVPECLVNNSAPSVRSVPGTWQAQHKCLSNEGGNGKRKFPLETSAHRLKPWPKVSLPDNLIPVSDRVLESMYQMGKASIHFQLSSQNTWQEVKFRWKGPNTSCIDRGEGGCHKGKGKNGSWLDKEVRRRNEASRGQVAVYGLCCVQTLPWCHSSPTPPVFRVRCKVGPAQRLLEYLGTSTLAWNHNSLNQTSDPFSPSSGTVDSGGADLTITVS